MKEVIQGKMVAYLEFVFTCLLNLSLPTAIGQIPNAGFERWSDGNPDSWDTDNDPSSNYIPITQTDTAHSGLYAVKGTVLYRFLGPFPPNLCGGCTTGFPVSVHYVQLRGYYQWIPIDGDRLWITVNMLFQGSGVGVGLFEERGTVTAYREFVAQINYAGNFIPDAAIIQIGVLVAPGDPTIHFGSTYYIGDLSFTEPTSVSDTTNGLPNSYALQQNYPNPLNPSTTITFSLPERSHVTLKVYDILGGERETLVNGERTSGEYSVSFHATNFSSGIYYYRLSTPTFMQTRSMIIIK